MKWAGQRTDGGREGRSAIGGGGGITRAVKVEAFRPCSAVQIQYVSIAFTCRGSASPRHRRRNFSAAVCTLATTSSETGSAWPSASAGRTRHDGHHLRESRREIVARLLVGDLVQLAEPPDPDQPRGLRLKVAGSVAGQCEQAHRAPGRASPSGGRRRRAGPRRSRMARGQPAPRYRRRGSGGCRPSRSGSAISVSTATTPSRPGVKSVIEP